MKIRVDNIPEEGWRITERVDPAQIEFDMPGYRLDEPLIFIGEAMRAGEDISLRGTLSGTVNPQCSRCLADFAMPVDLPMDVVYVFREERPEKEDETIEPHSNISYYEGDTLDLIKEIKDLLLVSLPIKPVCRADCKGLCLQCGADMNTAPCTCEQRPAASPFDKLEALKSKLEEK